MRYFGANLTGASRSIPLAVDEDDTIHVDYSTPIGTTNRRPFQVSDLPDAMQNPGNNSQETAQTVTYPCVVNGRIDKDGLRDFYRFHLDKQQHIALEVWSRRLGTPMDPELSLYDASGKMLGSDDDGRGRDARMERDLGPGTYTVRIRDIDDRGGIAFPYRLFLAPQQPRFRLVATPDAPTLSAGGSTVLTVRAERTDGFDGDITVTATGLPAAVTAAPLIIAKGQQEGKLTLTAAAGAPSDPFRIRVIGTGKSGDKEIRAVASTSETYNIQGTAYQRELLGPIVLIAAK